MEFRKFFVYIDDGTSACRIPVSADSMESAEKYVKGNGDVIIIRDVTSEYEIMAHDVAKALLNSGMDESKVVFILTALLQTRVVK